MTFLTRMMRPMVHAQRSLWTNAAIDTKIRYLKYGCHGLTRDEFKEGAKGLLQDLRISAAHQRGNESVYALLKIREISLYNSEPGCLREKMYEVFSKNELIDIFNASHAAANYLREMERHQEGEELERFANEMMLPDRNPLL